MKTQSNLSFKKANKTLSFLVMLFAMLSFGTTYGQETSQNERTIKGTITDGYNPIEGATIALKSTRVGTVSDSKGEFTFPRPLKTGDVLLISYLGYKNQELTISDKTNSLEIVLTEDLIEFTGALNSEKPYKSKRLKKSK